MKKSIKLLIAISVAIILYLAFYLFLVKNATPEYSPLLLSVFSKSLTFAIVGISIGVGLAWLLQKNRIDPFKTDISFLILMVVWGYAFGWLSITGVIIGWFTIDKPLL